MIDILPPTQKKMIRRIRTLRIITTSLFAIGTLIGISAILLLPTLETIATRKVALTAYTRQLEEQGALVSAADIAAIESRSRILSEKLLARDVSSPLTYIRTIQPYILPGIRINGYELASAEKRTMRIMGVASTRQALQEFIAALQGDTSITAVDSPIANFVKSSESEFTITVGFGEI